MARGPEVALSLRFLNEVSLEHAVIIILRVVSGSFCSVPTGYGSGDGGFVARRALSIYDLWPLQKFVPLLYTDHCT